MIFRKNAARAAAAPVFNTSALAMVPPRRRIVATWRRDEATGRMKIVWKLVDDIRAKAGV